MSVGHNPTGRAAVAAAGMTAIQIPCASLPPRYFVDHLRFTLDAVTNATQIADMVVTDDSAGDMPIAARVQNAPIVMGQGNPTTRGGLIYPGQLIWTARMVVCWVQLDLGTANLSVSVVWRPTPI